MTQAESDAQRERAIELAQRDLADIAALLDFEPFQRYYQRRLTERLALLKEDIAANDSLTDLETRTQRALARQYADLLAMPAQERAIHAQALQQLKAN